MDTFSAMLGGGLNSQISLHVPLELLSDALASELTNCMFSLFSFL